MKIIVTITSSGERIELEVEPSDTVQTVKEKIEEIQGIAVDKQRYIFNLNVLKYNDIVLGDVGIENGSTIYEETVSVSDT